MFAPKRGEDMRAALDEAWRNRRRIAQELRDLAAEAGVPGTQGH